MRATFGSAGEVIAFLVAAAHAGIDPVAPAVSVSPLDTTGDATAAPRVGGHGEQQ